ncbi:uncharacterized protein BDR25DRAFT_98121 [Lindgomyces ingoldianus]|uniref:Uncharacterized protein n=1 Tax=Lindgomyces ingoldianus TaxID=673940 RepID=A0ACB6QCH7_9PLEO|nr:uncharacterized protein BDR25DRAFT_98121 [Lindgomyces ingoldianus]KAF2464303.1 hypothetical protein BDR25DRAFT_98121 [Lindgomyces ingoldianus]
MLRSRTAATCPFPSHAADPDLLQRSPVSRSRRGFHLSQSRVSIWHAAETGNANAPSSCRSSLKLTKHPDSPQETYRPTVPHKPVSCSSSPEAFLTPATTLPTPITRPMTPVRKSFPSRTSGNPPSIGV